MKKFKLLNILLVLAFIFTMPVAYAHDIEVDKVNVTVEDNEGNIYSGSKVVVNENVGEYDLYYQYVVIKNDAYKEYDKKLKEQQEWIKDFLEANNLSSIDDASKDLIASYNEAVKEYEAQKEQLLPAYVEDAWTQSTDNTVKLDLTKIPENSLGYQPYTLWLKVVPKDEGKDTIYSNKVVIAKKQTEDIELKEENASTGDNIIWIGLAAVALAGIMAYSYKKSNA